MSKELTQEEKMKNLELLMYWERKIQMDHQRNIILLFCGLLQASISILLLLVWLKVI